MPPKDDEEAKTTKEVITKKHKQMLNREELDLSLVAEAFGGVLVEEPKVVQLSLPGTDKKTIKKQEVPSQETPIQKLQRLLKTSRADKYKTNEPVSGKQAQQFDIDISGKAADEKSGAGGKPGAGQTKSLRGQTLTKGPYKGATPIGKREASLLRKYASSPGVGQNPLRSEPGSGAELTAGRRRSLKASARRAVEKQSQARRSAVGKQIRQAGSELLSQMQKQAKKGKEVQSRMAGSVKKWIKKEGPEALKQVRGEVKPKDQLSLPNLGRSFGQGATARGAAAQDAAIDIAKYERKVKGMGDLAKAVKGARPVSGAAADPWKQFPRKPQPQRGLPTTGPSSPLPRTQALPPAKSQPVPSKPTPAAKPTGGMSATQARQLLIPGYGSSKASKAGQTLRTISSFPFVGGRVKAFTNFASTALDLATAYRKARDERVKKKQDDLDLSLGLRPGRQPSETPSIVPLKPRQRPSIKPIPATPKVKPSPEPETEPQVQPEKDKKKPKVTAPPKPKSPSDIVKAPGKTDAPTKVPDLFKYPVPPKVGPGVRTPSPTPKSERKRKGRLPGLGFPEQPGGVIGRRSNPQ